MYPWDSFQLSSIPQRQLPASARHSGSRSWRHGSLRLWHTGRSMPSCAHETVCVRARTQYVAPTIVPVTVTRSCLALLLFTLANLRFHLFDIVTCSHSFHTLLVLLFYKCSLVPICNFVSYSYLNWKPAQHWCSDCCPVTLVAERMVFFELLVFITGACIPLPIFVVYVEIFLCSTPKEGLPPIRL